MASLLLAYVAASQTFELPPGVLSAICFVESSHKAYRVHKDDGPEDSIGLCQLHLSTAKWMGYQGTEKGLLEPHTNAFWAAAYLRHNLNRYHGNLDKAIIAYNSGHYDKTNQKYLNKVLKAHKEHR